MSEADYHIADILEHYMAYRWGGERPSVGWTPGIPYIRNFKCGKEVAEGEIVTNMGDFRTTTSFSFPLQKLTAAARLGGRFGDSIAFSMMYDCVDAAMEKHLVTAPEAVAARPFFHTIIGPAGYA